MPIPPGSFEDIRSRLYTAVLSDSLDHFGRPRQAMRPFVRPLDDGLVLIGRVRTGLYMDIYSVVEGENPYEVEIALVDDLGAGDVAVFACSGPSERMAPWGELLSTAATCRGAVGCVTDGLVRDVRRIREMRFPVFAGGIGPLDSRGRCKMMAMDVPVECGGVTCDSGDYVFGDADGVVVIPQVIATQVIDHAMAKVDSEDHTRRELLEGKTLRDVYDTYGVL